MKCNVVEDLLPGYVESMCSPETKQDIEQHIACCQSCREKLERMQQDYVDKESGPPFSPEDIRPFQKIRKKMRRNRIMKVTAFLLLILVCGIFGTLTVGQFFPTLSCPSFDSIKYRFRAKNFAEKLASGDMKGVLKEIADVPSYEIMERDLFYDVAGHLEECYQKAFQGKEIKVSVDGVSYEESYVDAGDLSGATSNYNVRLTLKAGEDTIFMRVVFDNGGRYWFVLWMGENEISSTGDNNVLSSTDKDSLEYIIHDMMLYLYYYKGNLTGLQTNVEQYLTNARISNMNAEQLGKMEHFSGSSYSMYFTDDCMKLGNKETIDGTSAYSDKVGKRLYEVFRGCKSNDFQLANKRYNTDEKKYNAALYWKITDLKGKECILMKNFYFGPTGYEPVDNKETVCSEPGFDRRVLQAAKEVFDR